jgi:hypothetical protein
VNISLDWDHCYTRDPQAWNDFIDVMQQHGHNIYVVTMRHENAGRLVKEALANKVEGIFFTNCQAKKDFMVERGIHIDVWIDDQPYFILHNASNPTLA